MRQSVSVYASSLLTVARAAASIVVAALATACVTHAPMADDYSGPRALPESVVRSFTYPSQPISVEDERVRRRFGVTVREFTFPSAADPDRPIRIEHYDVGSNKPTPVILVLPIFNGQLLVSRYFARHFANQGWAAILVDRDRPGIEDGLLDPEDMIRAHLIEYMRVLDWIEENDEFDTSQIGVFGISLGGMDAVMLAALDERINSVVAAMAGGDLSYLLMNTSYRTINRSVANVLDESGLTREALEQELNDSIHTEPIALAPYVNAEDVLLVLTRGDWIVPFKAQQELLESLGQPESVFLPTGHRTSVVYFPLLRSTAHEFFARRFATVHGPLARE
jgi:dienelactone hydrolase